MLNEPIIQSRLMRERYHKHFVLPNYTPRNWWECDLFEVTKAGYFREYEIKVSVSDFRADRNKIQRQFHNFGEQPKPDINTHRCLLSEDLPECSVTLPKWGMMQDGVCWERMTSVLPIVENASGFWPTPCAIEPEKNLANYQNKAARPRKEKGGGHGPNLATAVNLWPTPTVGAANHGVNKPNGKRGQSLKGAIVAGWSTPNQRDWKDSGPTQGNRKNPNLGTQIHGATMSLSNAQTESLGQLNPEFVEWLMGWPIGWTELKPLEMDKSQLVQQQHGGF